MRIRSPSSRGNVALRLSPFDIALAVASPVLALHLRNAEILMPFDTEAVTIYVFISFTCSLIGFAIFRIYGGIPSYLFVNDVVDLAKAVLLAELMTCSALFVITRLDSIPRSAPAIHALILGTGLFTIRLMGHIAARKRRLATQPQHERIKHIILIGLSDLSVLFMKFLETCAPARQRVIGLLEAESRWIGRSVNGVAVLGPPGHLETLIDEFTIHGVTTDQVVVGAEPDRLSVEAIDAIRSACKRRGVDLVFVSDLFGLDPAGHAANAAPPTAVAIPIPGLIGMLSPYFRSKHLIEVIIAIVFIIVLMPLWLVGGLLAFFDVGSPILFWQRRAGLGGRDFQFYKIRTLKPEFDQVGQRVPQERRLSWIGRLLRQTRLDELPQLLSVIEGNMSLIGPRPLLLRDQPQDPSVRLMVRPGITGWAQVNGGTLLSPEEKEALDAWYVGHASLWLDLRIMAMTARSLLRGDRRSEQALAQARNERGGIIHRGLAKRGGAHSFGPSRFPRNSRSRTISKLALSARHDGPAATLREPPDPAAGAVATVGSRASRSAMYREKPNLLALQDGARQPAGHVRSGVDVDPVGQ
jgi:lipopolysaccharide/colanic/teichoic acid biosynthesis glycosyltransferase